MSLNIVPPEILVEILRFLDPSSVYSFSLVNKYLSATATPLLWHSPILHHEDQFTQFLSSLAMTTKQLGHHVRELNLDTPHCPTDEEVLFLIERMPHLESFSSADSHQLTNSSLGRLSHYCPDLQELSLCSAGISYRAMHHLGQCKSLRSLSLKNCEELVPISLLPLADCPLEYLDLSGCKWLNAEDTAYDVRAFTKLKVLGLMCCQGVTTEFIQCLAQYPNPELTVFSITGCDISDDGIVSFVKAHPNLEHLTLMDCTITDTSLFAIQTHLPVLHYLEISYCNRITKSGVRHMIRNMPCLDLIGLKNCNIKLRDFPEVESSPNVYWASGIHVDRFTVYELELVRKAESQPPTPETDSGDNTDIETETDIDVDVDDEINISYPHFHSLIIFPQQPLVLQQRALLLAHHQQQQQQQQQQSQTQSQHHFRPRSEPEPEPEQVHIEEPYSELAENIHENYSYIQDYLNTL